MATVLVQRWQWVAPLEALADETVRVRRDLADRLSRSARGRQALKNFRIDSDVGGAVHLQATNAHPQHDLILELTDDAVTFLFEPSRPISGAAMLRYLRTAAEPVLDAVVAAEWFEPRALRAVASYDLSVGFSKQRRRGAATDQLIAAFATPLAHPDRTPLAEFGSVTDSVPHELGVRATYAAKVGVTRFELSVEIFGDREYRDNLRASVILLSPEYVRPERPWFSNAGAMHSALWPSINRFFAAMEDQGGTRRNVGTKGSKAKTRRKPR